MLAVLPGSGVSLQENGAAEKHEGLQNFISCQLIWLFSLYLLFIKLHCFFIFELLADLDIYFFSSTI